MSGLTIARTHTFKGGIVRVYTDRTCRFFPHWCHSISTLVSRQTVAEQLRILRRAVV